MSNLLLEEALEAHRARVAKDKGNIMTMLFKRVAPGHHLRTAEDDLCLALSETGRMLTYQEPSRGAALFPGSVFEGGGAVELRYDLLDCHIHICSPEVMMLLTDEFDCQSIPDLVRFVLHTDELRDNFIHTHILEHEYAARVINLQSYEAITRDVVSRWAFPMVPDLFAPAHGKVEFRRNNVYLAEGVLQTRGCSLQENVVVGARSVIGRDGTPVTTARNTVIGSNCKIGAGVTLEDAFIFDNVTIEDGCCVRRAVLSDGVTLLAGVHVEPGCVLAAGVVVGPSVTLPPHTRLGSKPTAEPDSDSESGGDDSEEEPLYMVPYDVALVGLHGQGHLLDYGTDREEAKFLRWGGIGDDGSAVQGDAADGDEAEYTDESESESESDETSDEEGGAAGDAVDTFAEEVLDLVVERVLPNLGGRVPLDELTLEISASRSAHNVDPHDVVVALIKAAVDCADESLDAKALTRHAKRVFAAISSVLAKYVETEAEQLQLLLVWQSVCAERPRVAPTFLSVLHMLYELEDCEVLTEEVCIRWFGNAAHFTSDADQALRKQAQPFITWLEEAEEESDSE